MLLTVLELMESVAALSGVITCCPLTSVEFYELVDPLTSVLAIVFVETRGEGGVAKNARENDEWPRAALRARPMRSPNALGTFLMVTLSPVTLSPVTLTTTVEFCLAHY